MLHVVSPGNLRISKLGTDEVARPLGHNNLNRGSSAVQCGRLYLNLGRDLTRHENKRGLSPPVRTNQNFPRSFVPMAATVTRIDLGDVFEAGGMPSPRPKRSVSVRIDVH
ncbi:hypothetical protein DPEC_G00137620 [Dallia pectoralis]|uniref:Uncharacterized protein n=1 Tax=Dallia pectoralis TaxID=75939 RepID=A0ACC2GM10_DALPE|nr:hypothetical protein DPEC_G00137620 [Dallia pectoralis]